MDLYDKTDRADIIPINKKKSINKFQGMLDYLFLQFSLYQCYNLSRIGIYSIFLHSPISKSFFESKIV